MKTVRWLTFAWGCLALSTMGYYASQWVIQVDNPLRHELGIGVGFGFLFGWPAWLGLPILAFFGRKQLGRFGVLVLISPVLLAGAVFAVLSLLGAE